MSRTEDSYLLMHEHVVDMLSHNIDTIEPSMTDIIHIGSSYIVSFNVCVLSFVILSDNFIYFFFLQL